MKLLINSRDAMPEGGSITLSVKSFQSSIPSVLVTVTDTGKGMDERTQARVFEPFFTTKRDSGGTGLGLASVRSIIKNHGGEIRLTSEVGKGTQFDILFPREMKNARFDRPVDTMEVSSFNLEDSKKIALIIDKDELSRRSVSRLLRRAGHKVHAVADGESALQYLSNEGSTVNLVFLDILAAELNDKSLCKQILEIRSDINVIAVSSQTNPDGEQKILAHGASTILKKPFDRVMLQAALALGDGRRPL